MKYSFGILVFLLSLGTLAPTLACADSINWRVSELNLNFVPLNFKIASFHAKLRCSYKNTVDVIEKDLEISFRTEQDGDDVLYKIKIGEGHLKGSAWFQHLRNCSYQLSLKSETGATIDIDLAGTSLFEMTDAEIQALIKKKDLAKQINAANKKTTLMQRDGTIVVIEQIKRDPLK